MRIQIVILSAVVLAASLVRAEDASALKDEKDKVSYAIGMSLGSQWKRNGLETNQVSLENLVHGIRDSMAGTNTLLTEQQAQETLRTFSQQMQAKATEKRRLESEKNKKEGETFLAENKSKPDVVTLPSGLQYKVLKDGSGDSPKATDTVRVHYQGTLIDGTEFDSSVKRGQPVEFALNNIIPCWGEGLQRMKVGEKARLVCPSDIAYGDQGRAPVIPGGATLVFEVELLGIKGR